MDQPVIHNLVSSLLEAASPWQWRFPDGREHPQSTNDLLALYRQCHPFRGWPAEVTLHPDAEFVFVPALTPLQHREAAAVLAATGVPFEAQTELYQLWSAAAASGRDLAAEVMERARLDPATCTIVEFEDAFDPYDRVYTGPGPQMADESFVVADDEAIAQFHEGARQLLAGAEFLHCPVSFESQVKLRSLTGELPAYECLPHDTNTLIELGRSGLTVRGAGDLAPSPLGWAVADRLHAFRRAAPREWPGPGRAIYDARPHMMDTEAATASVRDWLEQVGSRTAIGPGGSVDGHLRAYDPSYGLVLSPSKPGQRRSQRAAAPRRGGRGR